MIFKHFAKSPRVHLGELEKQIEFLKTRNAFQAFCKVPVQLQANQKINYRSFKYEKHKSFWKILRDSSIRLKVYSIFAMPDFSICLRHIYKYILFRRAILFTVANTIPTATIPRSQAIPLDYNIVYFFETKKINGQGGGGGSQPSPSAALIFYSQRNQNWPVSENSTPLTKPQQLQKPCK